MAVDLPGPRDASGASPGRVQRPSACRWRKQKNNPIWVRDRRSRPPDKNSLLLGLVRFWRSAKGTKLWQMLVYQSMPALNSLRHFSACPVSTAKKRRKPFISIKRGGKQDGRVLTYHWLAVTDQQVIGLKRWRMSSRAETEAWIHEKTLNKPIDDFLTSWSRIWGKKYYNLIAKWTNKDENG